MPWKLIVREMQRQLGTGELDPAAITSTELCEIETRMNTMPRKCLDFMTPQEAFAIA